VYKNVERAIIALVLGDRGRDPRAGALTTGEQSNDQVSHFIRYTLCGETTFLSPDPPNRGRRINDALCASRAISFADPLSSDPSQGSRSYEETGGTRQVKLTTIWAGKHTQRYVQG
jgi:hypothetical protein